MQISILQLKKSPDQPVTIAFAASAEALDLLEEGIQFMEPVTVDLKATYLNGSVLLQGGIRTTVILECSRCLLRFPYLLEIDLAEEIPEEESLSFVLTDLLREYYFSSLPVRLLCHPLCRGLCALCGVNQNDKQCDCQQTQGDQRLSILNKLLSF